MDAASSATLDLALPSLAATEALARRLAPLLRPGDAVLLSGPLGAGKSALARALLRAMAEDPALDVPSPSFTLVQSYETPRGTVHHYDLWRIEPGPALRELGLDDAFRDITLIEWPDRLGDGAPAAALRLVFTPLPDGARRLALSGWPPDRLRKLASEPHGPLMIASVSPHPRHAMILAAGLGTRMRPLTAETPKPMLELQGRPLLDHALDRLAEAGVTEVVVNAHWQAEKLEAHLAARSTGPSSTGPSSTGPHTTVLREETLRDTGGAVGGAVAGGLLGEGPFFVLNGDAFWLDGPVLALARLAEAMAMAIEGADAILLLHRGAQVMGEVGAGDFALDEWGIPRRPQENELVPYIFAGVQIVSPRLFTAAPPPPFSMNLLWDRAMQSGRLRGIVHDGVWFHLSSPPDLAHAEADLRERVLGDAR